MGFVPFVVSSPRQSVDRSRFLRLRPMILTEFPPMATTARIEANRRNAQSPLVQEPQPANRDRVKMPSSTATALTILPVLPQEDLDRVQERIRQWIDDLKPRNTVEQELAKQAACLTIDLERAQPISVGHMSRRVLLAARRRARKIAPQERQRLHELGSKLLYVRGPEPIQADQSPGDDDPGLLVAELEDTAAGCRWLLDRFAEYRRLLQSRTHWEEPTLLRFVRLLGKRVVEAVYDPVLNSIFVAWDVLVRQSPRRAGAVLPVAEHSRPVA